MEPLQIDLNEVVSKEVREQIALLEKQRVDDVLTISKQRKEIIDLKFKLVESDIFLSLGDYLRKEFSKITQTDKDDRGWYDSKQKNQFLFIEKILLNIFNVKKEANGWYGVRSDGSLAINLAVNYYTNKELVINLIKILMTDSSKEHFIITKFRMPYDYTKAEVIEYVSNPKYNTNGCIFGISEYWINSGGMKSNMPHDLIMKSPYILEDDVFAILLKTIKSGKPNYQYLFALPQYNKNVSKEQIIAMGECLIKMPTSIITYPEPKSFISNNLKYFNTKTLEFFFNLVQSDNQYNILHWEKFPNEYQMKFLKSIKFDEVLKILTNYSCTWTIEQKQYFLQNY